MGRRDYRVSENMICKKNRTFAAQFKFTLITIILYAKTPPAIPDNGTTDDRSLWSESPTGH